MVYECPYADDQRHCNICSNEPICYVSDYMLALYEQGERSLFKAELLSDQEEIM